MYRTILAIALSVSVTFAAPLAAAPATPEQLSKLASAMGIAQQLREQQQAIRQQGVDAARQYNEQIAAALPPLPSELKEQLDKDYQEYLEGLSLLIDIPAAVKSYTQLLAEELDGDEIVQLTAFYSSELGRKYVRSNRAIMQRWTSQLMTSADEQLQQHLERYLDVMIERLSPLMNQP